jgi:hypothetical protein
LITDRMSVIIGDDTLTVSLRAVLAETYKIPATRIAILRPYSPENVTPTHLANARDWNRNTGIGKVGSTPYYFYGGDIAVVADRAELEAAKLGVDFFCSFFSIF